MLAACVGAIGAAQAHGAETHRSKSSSREPAAGELAIEVTDDRLTLSVTDVPQVYLFGVIDADAPERFAELTKSGKIPNGSDIYLNSSSGSLSAGMALGRLFRHGSMVTHLGKPRRKGEPNTAICSNACAYAYFGGLYRWAPTGSDRIGLAPVPVDSPASGSTAAPPAPNDVAAYLKDMGIDAGAFAAAPGTSSAADMIWLTADQMMSSGLANNGRLPLTATFQKLSTGPYLILEQTDRHGRHRMTIECKPGVVTLTAVDRVGAERARDIVMRATRSYFEINRQEVLTQSGGGASVASDAVTVTRPYPPARLEYVIFGQSVGAWVGGRSNAFRNGFTFDLEPVRAVLKNYYQACWEAAPWPTRQNP